MSLVARARPASALVAARRQNQRVAREDDRIAHAGAAIKGDPAAGAVDGGDADRCLDAVAWADRGPKREVLAEIDRAVAGKLFADHGGDQPGGQHAVSDAAAEGSSAGVDVAEMHRIVVAA